MSKNREVFAQLDKMAGTQLQRTTYPAVLGDGQGNLFVYKPDGTRAPGKVWARVDGLGVCAVRCRKVAEQPELPVVVGYGRDRVLEVVSEDGERAVEFTGIRGRNVGPHRDTHDLFGSDPDFVRGLRFLPLLCTPTNPPSLSVYVWPYHYTYLGVHKYWPGGALDLTASLPATGGMQRVIVVCLDPATNTLTSVSGSDVTFPGAQPEQMPFAGADVAAVNATAYERSAAVRAYYGQTEFAWRDWIDDVRSYITHDMLNTDLANPVPKSLFDANTILKADADNTPEALAVAEQRLVGRITGGEITGLTAAQSKTLLAIDHGADLAGLTDDDHTNYVLLAPAADTRNVIQPTADTVKALVLKGYSATHSDNLLEAQSSAGAVLASISPTGQLAIPASGSTAGILLGGDANLYRTSANILKTDDSLIVAAGLYSLGSTECYGAVAVKADPNIYIAVYSGSDLYYKYPYINFSRARTGYATPSAVQAGDYLGAFNFYGYGAAGAYVGNAGFASLIESVSGDYLVGKFLFSASDGTSSDVGASKLFMGSGSSGTVFNDDGKATLDLRVEGDTDANLIFVDASTDKVGIGDNAPGEKLDVAGNINTTGVLKVDDVQVVSNRVVDARIDDVPNSGDATTDGIIAAIQAALIAHGLAAAA